MNHSSLIIGRQPLIEALHANRNIDRILFQKNVSGESIGEIRKLAADRNIPIQQVPAEKLNGITRANHQGVIAVAAIITYHDLQQVISQLAVDDLAFFIMLDGITDVRNIGAIARSAVCCGVQALIIPDKGVGALNEEAMKSSAGALQKIKVCRVHSLLKAIDSMHLAGIRVLTSAPSASKKLFETDFTAPCCIVMGSEDRGVQLYLAKAADEHFSIPMKSDFDSFNVSVATGIILYEAMKQRMK